MSRLTVLFDACVLYPAPLRSFLMYLALTDVFGARWTDAIHEEWMRGVLRERRDMTRQQVERIRDLMNAQVRDGLVAGYEHLIPTMTLPDPGDGHVLAAAIHGGADVIVTFNLRHFPAKTLAKHGVQAQHPDDFIRHLFTLAPDMVCLAAKRQRQSLKNPPMSVDDFLAALERQSLPKTVIALRRHADMI